MATVESLTKERMLEIEANSVVGGTVSGDNLILTKQDGSTINAGDVRGPQGDVGPAAVPVAHWFKANGSKAVASGSHGTWNKITPFAESSDPDSEYDDPNDKFVCALAGLWTFGFHASVNVDFASGKTLIVSLRKNGGNLSLPLGGYIAHSGELNPPWSGFKSMPLDLDLGDIIDLAFYTTDASAFTMGYELHGVYEGATP